MPEQIVTRVRRVLVEELAAHPSVQPLRGGGEVGRHLCHVSRRLADDHDPGRRTEFVRQRNEITQRQSNRGRQGWRGPGETEMKPWRETACFAMQVGKTESFGRPGDVEQQRLRNHHEEHVDELGARDHDDP